METSEVPYSTSSKKMKFSNCLGVSILFKQYKFQSTRQYFTNPHSRNSKTERIKCGNFGVVLKIVQVELGNGVFSLQFLEFLIFGIFGIFGNFGNRIFGIGRWCV